MHLTELVSFYSSELKSPKAKKRAKKENDHDYTDKKKVITLFCVASNEHHELYDYSF